MILCHYVQPSLNIYLYIYILYIYLYLYQHLSQVYREVVLDKLNLVFGCKSKSMEFWTSVKPSCMKARLIEKFSSTLFAEEMSEGARIPLYLYCLLPPTYLYC